MLARLCWCIRQWEDCVGGDRPGRNCRSGGASDSAHGADGVALCCALCVASGCRLLPTILTSSTSARCALTHPKVSSPKMPRMLCLVCQQDIGMVVARIAPSGTVVSAPCWTNQTKLAQHHARWEKHSFERPSPLYGCKLACALQQ
jgi:hypothetical protein